MKDNKAFKFTSIGVTAVFMLELVLPSQSWAQATPPATAPTSYTFGGQSGSSADSYLPQLTPSSLNFAGINGQLQSDISGCQLQSNVGTAANLTKAGLDIFTGGKKDKSGKAVAGSGGSCYDGSALNCSMSCPAPKVGDKTCDNYTSKEDANNNTYQKYILHFDKGAQLEADKKKVQTYLDFQDFRKNTCVEQRNKKLMDQVLAYQCALDKIDKAVQMAAQQTQKMLQANADQYGKANGFQQELGDQMKQIDDILGPEDGGQTVGGQMGGNQFKGLLGLQKALEAKQPEMDQKLADFNNQVDKIKQATDQNEQRLETDRMGVVSACMKGEKNLGGHSSPCFVPIKDKDGNLVYQNNGKPRYVKKNCGPLEVLMSTVEQQAYKNGSGTLVNGSRDQDAMNNTMALTPLLESINREIGDYDQPATGTDGKATGDRPLPRAVTWNEIQKKYASSIQSVAAQTGVSKLGDMLNRVGSFCFSDSYTWKNQQTKWSASPYNKAKSDITAQTKTLSAGINSGLKDLNNTFRDIYATVYGSSQNLNLFQCTESDPAKMANCYQQIKSNINDLKLGQGGTASVTRTIKGGTQTQTFPVVCKGLDDCVTKFQGARKAKKDQSGAAQRAKIAFVQRANSAVTTQLQSFGQAVAGVQQAAKAQYANLVQMFGSMGLSVPENPKSLDAEQLKPVEGPDKMPGTFEMPKSMAGVLSSFTQPSGILDTKNAGLSDLTKEIQKKGDETKKDVADAHDKYDSIMEKLNGINQKVCEAGSAKPSSDLDKKASNVTVSSQNCKDAIRSCRLKQNNSKPMLEDAQISTLKTVVSVIGKIANGSSKQESNASTLDGNLEKMINDLGDSDCKDSLVECQFELGAAKDAITNDDSSLVQGRKAKN